MDFFVLERLKHAWLSCKMSIKSVEQNYLFLIDAIDANATWYKDGRKLNSGYFAKQTFDGRLARLTLNKVTEREMGTYECSVSNTGGEVKTQAQLSFRGKGEEWGICTVECFVD